MIISHCDNFKWTPKGLSHTYTRIHSPPNSSPVQAATWYGEEFPELYRKSFCVIYFKYSSVYREALSKRWAVKARDTHRKNTHTQTHTDTRTHVLVNEWNNRNSATHAAPSSCVWGAVSLPLSEYFQVQATILKSRWGLCPRSCFCLCPWRWREAPRARIWDHFLFLAFLNGC